MNENWMNLPAACFVNLHKFVMHTKVSLYGVVKNQLPMTTGVVYL